MLACQVFFQFSFDASYCLEVHLNEKLVMLWGHSESTGAWKGEGVPKKAYESVQGGGEDCSKNVRALM